MVLTDKKKCSSVVETGEAGGRNRQRNRMWKGTEEGGAEGLGNWSGSRRTD